jgi:hypothetical protein
LGFTWIDEVDYVLVGVCLSEQFFILGPKLYSSSFKEIGEAVRVSGKGDISEP